MSSQIPDKSNCFVIPKQIITPQISIESLDYYFQSTESIILDYYELFHTDIERVLNVKNRQVMVVKVLVDHLNLSLSSCGSEQFPKHRPNRDLDFTVTSYLQQREKIDGHATLFHSRELYSIKFASVKSQDLSILFGALVNPIGYEVLVAGFLLLLILTVFIAMFYKFKKSYRSTWDGGVGEFSPAPVNIITFLLRGQIDQCSSCKMASKMMKFSLLRFIYGAWLFYCILITSTYKSKLIHQLMQPTSTISANTFEELLEDKRPIVSLGGGKNGLHHKLLDIMVEFALLNGTKTGELFNKTIYRYGGRSSDNDPYTLFKGKFNFIDSESRLRLMFSIFEKKFQINHYEISKVSFSKPEFWSVKASERSKKILTTLGLMASSGMLDHFRSQQEAIDQVATHKFLQVYFAGVFNAEDEEDEDDENEHKHNGKAKIPKQFISIYNRMKKTIKSMGKEISKGAEPITIRNYSILWIVLICGYVAALFSCFVEFCLKKSKSSCIVQKQSFIFLR